MIAPRVLHAPIALAAALALAACQATPAAAPAGPAQVVATASGVVVTIGPAVPRGTGRIQLSPKVVDGGERRLMAAVVRNTVATIDHVTYEISRQGNATAEDAITLSGPTMLNTITFANLENNTTYVVEAFAYTAANGLLNGDVPASATVTVGTDDRPAGAALLIKLDDVVFSGQATQNAVAVTDGGYSHPDTEDAEYTTPAGSALVAGGAAVAAAAPVDGIGADAKFARPVDVALGPDGNLYVADHDAHAIRKVTPGGIVSTVAGGTQGDQDGAGTDAQFDMPTGIVVDDDGVIYVSDGGNHRIKRIDQSGNVDTIAGSGEPGYDEGNGTLANFDQPRGLALDGAGNLYVADANNAAIRKIVLATNAVSTLAGAGAEFLAPCDLTSGPGGDLFVADRTAGKVLRVTLAGVVTDYATGLGDPVGIAARDTEIYVTDTLGARLYKSVAGGAFTFLAGSTGGYLEHATPASVRFDHPHGLAIGPDGHLYVADTDNHRVRRVFLPPLPTS